MNTLDFILNKYKISRDVKSPIKLHCSRWGTIPRLFRQLDFTLGAEIGVEEGRFSKSLCVGNLGLKVYSIDAWKVYKGYKEDHYQSAFDNMYLEARTRLAPYNCQIIRDWSMEAVKRFDDEVLDFVFIDSNHDYEYVSEDIREWSKKVRKGGIISGHDYVNGINGQVFGVKQAVNEWVEENNLKLFILNKRGCPSWMFVK